MNRLKKENIMENIKSLEEALLIIERLENENKYLKGELEYYKKRKASGRQKHNAKWTAIYNDFVLCYENGMSLEEIANKSNLSVRTLYRYKAYYDSLKKKGD